MSTGTLPSQRWHLAPAARSQQREAAAEPATLIVVGLTALAGALRFALLGHQGFWFDEANTALLVHFSPGELFTLLPKSESTPPLFYCLAWLWAHVFGRDELGLRSLTALAGTLTVPAIYLAGARLASRRAGLIAAALCAANPLMVWYSQEARSYSLLVLLSACGLACFAAARDEPTTRRLAWWSGVSVLALLTHYYALLLVVPQAVWLLARHPRRRAVWLAEGALLICGLALLPLALAQNATGHASWIAPIPLRWRFGQVFPQFLVGFQAWRQSMLYVICALVVALSLVLVLWLADRRERRAAAGLGALLAGGLAVEGLLVLAGIDDLITRNLIALWVPGALLVAAGLAVRRGRIVGLMATGVVALSGVVAVVSVDLTGVWQRPDWRGVSQLIGARPSSGTARAIFIQHYRDLLPLSLYLPGLSLWPGTDRKLDPAIPSGQPVQVREVDILAFSAPRVSLCWWGAACNLAGSHLQARYAIPGFRPAWRRGRYQFRVLRLLAATPTWVSPRQVAATIQNTGYGGDELLIQR